MTLTGGAKAGVPDDIVFQTKPQMALDQTLPLARPGFRSQIVLADHRLRHRAPTSRDGITEIRLPYAVGIQSSISLWPPGAERSPTKQWSGRGPARPAIRRDAEHQPVSAKQLASAACQNRPGGRVTWREGSDAGSPRASRRLLAALITDASTAARGMVLVEMARRRTRADKILLSTLPANISSTALVTRQAAAGLAN